MTFTDVKTYFEANRQRFADLAWDDPYQLSAAERRAVQASLQTFQRGESSDGTHLLALAAAWDAPDYVAALQLFMQEEATHGEVLGRFLDQQGLGRIGRHWLKDAFHQLGRYLGLENMLRVILTAEIIATAYYRALFNATYSGLLQQICRRILQDEEMHLALHCLAIRQLAGTRRGLGAWLRRLAYRGLLAGAALAVYASCRRTLRAGGYRLGTYCAALADEYARIEQMQRPGAPLVLRGSPVSAAAPGPAAPAGAWQWPQPSQRITAVAP
ncbi:ferritin-like domain-containing protein [Hymenobacter sp. RP-2-7]|uniref:Ferritin-like domain-containing protein n=1 Tax=Hymenobacter polaris TaxID=2682546 RepID=A0A7Y0ACA3_9BACT|nr:ferritin-like domain-containing protein [Hymenobacter polaris]NML64701.1 ferritin-like domain-containing protein [Hymenobacter polaris]